MPTITGYLNELIDLKSQLADNLVNKGVAAEQSEKFNTLVPKVLDISGGLEKEVLWDSNTHSEYENNVYIQYTKSQGNSTYSVAELSKENPNFCSEYMNYTLHYSVAIFGWDSEILSSSDNSVSITYDTLIAIRYNSDSTLDGELRLVSADEITNIEDVFTKARTEGEYTKINWHWVYANGFVTMCATCYDVEPGDYYVVWITHSDNTNVRIARIVVIS